MYRYLHLDVFTDRPFEGNQLAVFPEPQGLTAEHMQRIAKEMAFSETTFIFPAERGGDVRMRIFTPGSELPMAGHPTIGSTFALAIEGTIRRGRNSSCSSSVSARRRCRSSGVSRDSRLPG